MRQSPQTTAVALLDRQLRFRQGLECLLRQSEEVVLVGSISSPDDIRPCFARIEVDVLVLDLDFPGYDLSRLIHILSREFPDVDLLVLTAFEEEVYAERMVRAGVRGFLNRADDFENLLEAIAKIRKGQLALSPAMEAVFLSRCNRWRKRIDVDEIDTLSDRELLVLSLVGQGQSTPQIAKAMGISPKTVGSYKERIKEKLNLYDCRQLMPYAMRGFASGQT